MVSLGTSPKGVVVVVIVIVVVIGWYLSGGNGPPWSMAVMLVGSLSAYLQEGNNSPIHVQMQEGGRHWHYNKTHTHTTHMMMTEEVFLIDND